MRYALTFHTKQQNKKQQETEPFTDLELAPRAIYYYLIKNDSFCFSSRNAAIFRYIYINGVKEAGIQSKAVPVFVLFFITCFWFVSISIHWNASEIMPSSQRRMKTKIPRLTTRMTTTTQDKNNNKFVDFGIATEEMKILKTRNRTMIHLFRVPQRFAIQIIHCQMSRTNMWIYGS